MFFLKKKEIPITDIFSNSFVDIHSHLLPGIDDGAKNMDMTIELISKMNSFGIRNFITTPHVLGGLYENSTETILQKLAEVQKELKNRGMEEATIRAAAEYMLDEQFLERLKNNDILTLKDDLVLVEMSYLSPPINLFDILFEIQLQGYKPVLAHPERYNFYHNDFSKYQKLKNAGCLFQLNLLALTPHYGTAITKIAHELLDLDLYDFVGTDTHHLAHLQSLNKIGNLKTAKKIEHLIENNKVFL